MASKETKPTENEELKVGDHVEWNSRSGGPSRGPCDREAHTWPGCMAREPAKRILIKFVVVDEGRGKEYARNPDKLHKVEDAEEDVKWIKGMSEEILPGFLNKTSDENVIAMQPCVNFVRPCTNRNSFLRGRGQLREWCSRLFEKNCIVNKWAPLSRLDKMHFLLLLACRTFFFPPLKVDQKTLFWKRLD